MKQAQVNTSGWVTVKYTRRSAPVSFTGPVTGQNYTIGDGEATLMQEADAAAALKLVRHGRPVFELFVEAPLPDVRGIAPNDVSPTDPANTIYITGELQGSLSVPNDATSSLFVTGDTGASVTVPISAGSRVIPDLTEAKPETPALAPKKRKARAQTPEAE